MRVLVVEDDRDLNRQLVSALTDAGYAVDAAFDGEEGYFLGDTEPYDVVILDTGLPKMDGIRVLEQWRRAERKMPVIILTARDRWSDKVAGMDAGADDYVVQALPHAGAAGARARAGAPRLRPRQERHRVRAAAPRHQDRPRHTQRPARQAHLARIPAARLPACTTTSAWCRAPSWSSTSTSRTSTATPTPSRCSSAGCARRSRRT